MKSYLAKTKIASLLAIPLITSAVFLTVPTKAATLVNYNFDSLTPGSINGQDGWTSANNAQVATTPIVGPGGTYGLSNGTVASGAVVSKKNFFSAGSLSSSDTVTLTFQAYQDTSGSVELFGIGLASTDAAHFGIWNGTLFLRERGFGTAYNAKNASGNDILFTNDSWYSIQSVWNLSTGTATLFYKNLTAGDVSYTQAFFNAAQTQASVSIGSVADVSSWTSGWVRTGTTAVGIGYLDNLSAVSVPEPNALVLGMIGLGVLVVRAQRRRASFSA
ncbi:MAG: hypothetical protein J0I10_22355 [Verrucomicrobia bacterium]|nr:hypothetical protein [Verrucomicrobiota bacterium]